MANDTTVIMILACLPLALKIADTVCKRGK